MSTLKKLALVCENSSESEKSQEAPKKRAKRKNRSELEKLQSMDMGPVGGGRAGDMVAKVGQKQRDRHLARDSLKEIEEELGEPKRKYKRTGRGRKTGVAVVPVVPERPEVPEVPEIPAKARKVRAKFGFMASEIQELKEASEHPWEIPAPAPEIPASAPEIPVPAPVEEPKTIPELENAPEQQDEQDLEKVEDAPKMVQKPVVLVEEPMEVTQELQVAPAIQNIQNENAPELIQNSKMLSSEPQNAPELFPELGAPILEDDIQKHPTPIVLEEQELEEPTAPTMIVPELQDAPELEATDAPNALRSELQSPRNQEPELQNAPELLVSELQAQDIQKLSGELQKDQEPTSELQDRELQNLSAKLQKDQSPGNQDAPNLQEEAPPTNELQNAQQSEHELFAAKEVQKLLQEAPAPAPPTKELEVLNKKAQMLEAPIVESSNNQDAPAILQDLEHASEALSVNVVSPANQDAPELQNDVQKLQDAPAPPTNEFEVLNKKALKLGAPIVESSNNQDAPNGLSLVLHDAQNVQQAPEKDAQLDVLPSMLSPPALPAPELQLSFTEVLTMEWQDTSAPGAPGAQEPGAQEPGAQEPGAQEPGAQEPGAQEPGAQEPGAQEPVGADPELAEPRVARVAQIKEEVITISDDEEEEEPQRQQVFPMGYMPLFPLHMANVLQGYFNPIPMPIYPMMYPRGL